jgi:hypothetical protein
MRSDEPFSWSPIAEEGAEQAWGSVIAGVGATRPKRDSVDLRVVQNAIDGGATFEGPTYRAVQGFPASAPVTGIIDSQTEVGGWPVLNSAAAPLDGDHDGMPDDWENAHELDRGNPLDRNGLGVDGYTNLELYLNSPSLLTGVKEGPGQPVGMRLEQNYPNPFNPTTTLEFSVGESGEASLRVYNLLGQLVRELHRGTAEVGVAYRIPFDAEGLSSGVYFSVLESAGRRLVRKMVGLK